MVLFTYPLSETFSNYLKLLWLPKTTMKKHVKTDFKKKDNME